MPDEIHEALRRMAVTGPSLKKGIGGQTTPEAISSAEATLGIQLPDGFRLFLSRHGWGGPRGTEIYGVSDHLPQSEYPSLVKANEDARGWNCPQGLIVFASAGDGGFYALADARENDDSVFVWYPGSGASFDELEISDDNFGSWLLRNIQDAIDLQQL
jgi:SMI1 / KNR4 family.